MENRGIAREKQAESNYEVVGNRLWNEENDEGSGLYPHFLSPV